jgi:site-specific DNA-cytosine methylase
MLTEAFAMGAVGIPFESIPGTAVDTKCQEFMNLVHRRNMTHIFENMRAFCKEPGVLSGHCILHGRACVEVVGHPADIVFGGSSCQPFSRNRTARFSTSDDKSHPQYDATFGDETCRTGSVIEVLKVQRPLGGVLEQVPGSSMKSRGAPDCALDRFLEALRNIKDDKGNRLYTGIVTVQMDAATFLDIARPRTECCSVSCVVSVLKLRLRSSEQTVASSQ